MNPDSSDALTLDAAIPVIEQAMSNKTVLVGGQAINLWATLLGVDIHSPYLTRDIDFIGSQQDAIRASNKLTNEHKLVLATQDSAGINSAVILVKFPGESKERIIDYLISVYGVDRNELELAAIEMQIDGLIIRVIHPFHLMQSKISNLSLKGKQSAEGIAQANASIDIFRAFLLEFMRQPESTPRLALKLIRKVIHFTKSHFAVSAFHAFAVDTLKAIPIVQLQQSGEPILEKFALQGFLVDITQVNKFRQTK